MPIYQVIANIPNLFLGIPVTKADNYVDEKAREVTLYSEKPYEFTLDAEVYTAQGKTTIDAGTKLKFLAFTMAPNLQCLIMLG